MKTTILHVEAYDDIYSIRDRISWCRSQRILLILPRRRKDLAEPLDLQLIERAARDSGAQLGIVSKDGLIRENAKRLGINVFRTISAAERDYWIEKGVRTVRRSIRGKDGILAEKRQLPVPSSVQVVSKNSLKVIYVVALVLVVFLLVIVLPSAKVLLYPKTISQIVKLEIRASTLAKQSNVNGLIPAWKETYTLTASQSGRSSGSVKVGKEKAQGELRVVNLSGKSFELPAGTIFLAGGSNGQRFMTENDLTIPADSNGVKIPVRAVLAGEEGNIKVGEVNLVEGVYGSFIEVINEEAFSGGTSITLPAPTTYDYTQLRRTIISDLSADILEMYENDKSSQSRPIIESLELEEILQETMTNPIGEASDTANLELTARFRMLFYDPEDLDRIALDVLDLSISPEYHPVRPELSLTRVGDVTVYDASEATWQVEANRLIVPDYSRRALLQSIKGMTRSRAIAFLNEVVPQYRSAQVNSFPSWWPYLPNLINRIQFEERVADEG